MDDACASGFDDDDRNDAMQISCTLPQHTAPMKLLMCCGICIW